jgi:hypothetical protein
MFSGTHLTKASTPVAGGMGESPALGGSRRSGSHPTLLKPRRRTPGGQFAALPVETGARFRFIPLQSRIGQKKSAARTSGAVNLDGLA